MSAVHIINGVVQLMRLYPSLTRAPLKLKVPVGGDLPTAYVNEIKARLGELYKPQGGPWRLPKRAVGFCVTGSKNSGGLTLAKSSHEVRSDTLYMAPARAHAETIFSSPPSARAHDLIASALNADGRVYISANADDPTTTGLHFAGYSNNYTLDLMHASTLLALVGAGAGGEVLLRKLYDLLQTEEGPHHDLVSKLGLTNSPPAEPHLDETIGANNRPFPLPPGEGWAAMSEVAAATCSRLFAWAESGEARTNVLMTFSDLGGLLLSCKFARWAGCQPLLMTAPLAPRQRDAALIIEAQRSLQATLARVDAEADDANLIEIKQTKNGTRALKPKPVYRNLLQATGWLFPKNAQGGAKQYLRPGARQLMTLTRALIEPGEELSWQELRSRAHALHIELGGAPTAALPSSYPALLLARAGDIHKEHMVALGLARQESDNVVRVDGGWA